MFNRPVFVSYRELIQQFAFLPNEIVENSKITYQEPKYGQPATVFIFDDEFFVNLTDKPQKPYYITCNSTDPDEDENGNELFNAMQESIKSGRSWLKMDGDIVWEDGLFSKAENFYGAYTATLLEAVEIAIKMKNTPLKEWPKEYIKPVPID